MNFLTLSRGPSALIGALLAIWHCASPSAILFAAAILLLIGSGATDLLDGVLARRWQVTSRFGALADPLMDKIFYVATLPVALFLALLAEDGFHAVLLLILNVLSMLRDQWVSFLRSVGSLYDADMRATLWGKLRTALAFPVIVLAFLFLGLESLEVVLPYPVRWSLLFLEAAVIVVTAISAVSYTINYWPSLQRAMQHKEEN